MEKEKAFIQGKIDFLLGRTVNPYSEYELRVAWEKGREDSIRITAETQETMKKFFSKLRVIKSQKDIDQLVSDISIKMDERQN